MAQAQFPSVKFEYGRERVLSVTVQKKQQQKLEENAKDEQRQGEEAEKQRKSKEEPSSQLAFLLRKLRRSGLACDVVHWIGSDTSRDMLFHKLSTCVKWGVSR